MPELTSQAFQRLLSFLDSDPDRAGERYEDLRRRLVYFFEGRQCGHASELLADRTLDVAANKLAEGLQLASFADLSRYCLGVGRNVIKDHARQQRTTPLEIDPPAPSHNGTHAQANLQCLERCLATLAPESRKLILEFYVGERRAKIENRARLADGLAITPNALRRRTHTIRARLESCIRDCVDAGGTFPRGEP